VLWLVVFTLLVAPQPIRAQTGMESPSHRVEIILVGKAGQDPEFGGRITSWFDSTRFRVGVHRAAEIVPQEILSPQRDQTVHAWVVLASPDRARIYFATTMGPKNRATYLLRDLALEQGLDEMGAERIAQVLYLSTVALVDGQAASGREEVERLLSQETTTAPSRGLTQPRDAAKPAESPRRQPVTRARARRRDRDPGESSTPTPALTVQAGVGYGASARGDEGIWHGPRATLLVRFRDGFGAQALVQSALPTTRGMQDLELQFYGGLLGIAGSYQHELFREAKLEWSVGPGLEVVHYRPVRSLSSEITAGRGDTEARPAAVASVSAVFRDSRPKIVVALQGVAPLLDSHYDVVVGDQRRVVGKSWALVPSLGMEARF